MLIIRNRLGLNQVHVQFRETHLD